MRTLVPMLAEQLNIPDQPLIEKDVRLHLLLGRLTRDRRFGPHVAFKGGTCLIKCYLDYPLGSGRTSTSPGWIPGPKRPVFRGDEGLPPRSATHAARARDLVPDRGRCRWVSRGPPGTLPLSALLASGGRRLGSGTRPSSASRRPTDRDEYLHGRRVVIVGDYRVGWGRDDGL